MILVLSSFELFQFSDDSVKLFPVFDVSLFVSSPVTSLLLADHQVGSIKLTF